MSASLLRRSGRAVLLVLVLALGAAAAAPAVPAQPGGAAGEPRAARDPRAPAGFTALDEVAPSVLHDIRYRTADNFTGAPVPGYREPLCLLERRTALALRRVQRTVLARGLSLKVYDCYRPQRAVDRFADWATEPEDPWTRQAYHPEVRKDRLFAQGWIARRSGHSRGSTVDLTLVGLPARPPTAGGRPTGAPAPCYAPQEQRAPDNSLDMGTGYDCFDPRSALLDPRVDGAARANRLLLRDAMGREGFVNLPSEWWHFTRQPEAFPERYFDFPVARGSLTR